MGCVVAKWRVRKVVAVGFAGNGGARSKGAIAVDECHCTGVGIESSGSPGEWGSWSGD